MSAKELKNKPLAEAILEAKWALRSQAPGVSIDPHYKLLLGRFYDRVSSEYPEHEQLPTATIPDEIVGQAVQHRFRKAPNDWPLLQLGPGILTVNDTHRYTWSDFKKRSVYAVSQLFEAYPKREELTIDSLVLRYIDAVEMDYRSENVFLFLKDKMKIDISLPEKLFEKDVENRPEHFNWQSSFRSDNPKGVVTLRFATGNKKSQPALVWETMLQSAGDDVPALPRSFESWIEAAHTLTEHWFFSLIEGDLERIFSGD